MEPTQTAPTGDNNSSLESSGSLESSAAPSAVPRSPITASTPLTSDPSLNSLDSTNLTPETPEPKQPFLKRLWQRVNIYFLLFVIVFLICTAVAIGFFVKDKSQAPSTNVGTQNLSPSQLQQLANSDTNIGSSKQTLNIQSNAIFSGTILVRQDLEVAGNIRVNGALTLPGITVSGLSNFNQIQAGSVAITGSETVQGSFTAKNGISVSGNSSFNGSVSATQVTTGTLQLNGDLILTHHIIGGGAIPSIAQGVALGGGGTASVSGSDTSGSLTINTGSGPGAGCFATISFARAFASTPHVNITPVGAAAGSLQFYVNRSTSSFSVCTTSAPAGGQTFGFDYLVIN